MDYISLVDTTSYPPKKDFTNCSHVFPVKESRLLICQLENVLKNIHRHKHQLLRINNSTNLSYN